ncbi:MAG: hypothetical protein Q9220_003884 [cf. Caloplaca sp. 1 TL-2023]
MSPDLSENVSVRPILFRCYYNPRAPLDKDRAPEGQLKLRYHTYFDMRLSDMKAQLRHWKRIFEASEAYEKFTTAVHIASAGFYVRNIAIFSIGTFQDIDDGARCRSYLQLAAVLTIRDIIKGSQSKYLQCFVQDPLITSLDEEFLRLYGIETLYDPVGFCAIDKGLSEQKAQDLLEMFKDYQKEPLLQTEWSGRSALYWRTWPPGYPVSDSDSD